MLFLKRTFNSNLFTTLKILLTHATYNAFQTFNTEPVLNQSSYILYFYKELGIYLNKCSKFMQNIIKIIAVTENTFNIMASLQYNPH